MELLNLITENPIISTLLIVITIIGFIFTYKSTPQKKLKFTITDNVLITNKQSDFSKLKVYYNSQNVDKLTVTKITLWNASFPPLCRSDIAKTAPLSILISDGEILDASVLKGNDTANHVEVRRNTKGEYYVTFEYLNRKEGGLIQLVHTGGINSIDISRTLIGGKIIVSKNSNVSLAKIMLMSGIITIISVIGMLLVIALGMHYGISEIIITIASIIAFAVVVVIMMLLITKDFVPKNCKN